MNKNKLFIFIFNAVIASICVLAIVGHFFSPVWTMRLNINLTEEAARVLTDNKGDNGTNYFLKAFYETVREKDISAKFSVHVYTSDALGALFDPTDKTLRRVIDRNFDLVWEDLKDLTQDVLLPNLTEIVKNGIVYGLEDNLKKNGKEDTAAIVAKLAENKDFTSKVTELYDRLNAGELSSKEAADGIVSAYNDLVKEYKNDGGTGLPEIGTDSASMEKVLEVLKKAENENGKLTADGIIEILLSEGNDPFIPEDEKENNAQVSPRTGAPAGVPRIPALRSAPLPASAGEEEPEGEKNDSVKEAVRSKLYTVLERGNILKNLRILLAVTGGLIVLSFLVWLYPIVKMIFKIFRRNPGVTLTAPIVFGYIPYLLLTAIPSIFALFINRPKLVSSFAAKLGVASAGIEAFLGMFKLRFISSSLIALICAAALLIIFFFYKPLCIRAEDSGDETAENAN